MSVSLWNISVNANCQFTNLGTLTHAANFIEPQSSAAELLGVGCAPTKPPQEPREPLNGERDRRPW
jgi:hypothetical protein